MKMDSWPIVFQNVTLIKMQLDIAKAQFRQALENLERAPEEHKIEFMKEVGKILPTAVTLAQETRDPELEALIRQVQETLMTRRIFLQFRAILVTLLESK